MVGSGKGPFIIKRGWVGRGVTEVWYMNLASFHQRGGLSSMSPGNFFSRISNEIALKEV